MGNIKNNIKPGQYYYEPYGARFRIYRCEENTSRNFYARPVESEPTYHDREAARRRVYELNGWKQ